jgi:hypothetical protein
MLNHRLYPWLIRTGQLWKLRAEVWVGLLGFAGLLLGLLSLLAAFTVGPVVLWAAGVFWALYGFAKFGVFWLKYHHIRCPRCGYNPTREADSGRRLPDDVVHEHLAIIEICPACAYGGPEQSV